jgi:hypothetical protein
MKPLNVVIIVLLVFLCSCMATRTGGRALIIMPAGAAVPAFGVL